MQWARERVPVGLVHVHVRGGGGHLEVLQWLRQNGARGTRGRARPWHREATWRCFSGRVDGCPWNKETRLAAVGAGHMEVHEWARRNGCPE